ncbi:hypothetical protein CONPUDRAFT_138211 [Coniophora puteana RWD-64-598 SS2]|uniref:Uncharacterized protein n=1 Tax=Coniophora puteana (strain RWD-64-598) TaxID=741705 RepID=A0A5M3MJ39_CONPW|nr:uncharacterized protein CONPUDRAFT_138211 [Coniophora puteana RWD-64-598 SS2]EIW78940.1 hypothetical protein CONPUDRAFT_138211 [Coniophora puteana RWD-64-598 SS2]
MEDSQQDVAQEPALDELPPVKRRRTLAGTIVSTAVSAVLIGTAVGLTAYRLWRDRGQEFAIEASPGEDPEEPRESHEDSSDMGPPPPYHAEDYHRSRVAPPSPKPHRRAQAPHHSSAFKRPTNTQRRRVAAAGRHHQASASSQSSYLSVPTRPEFDFRSQPLSREGDADVEMDVEGDGGAEEEVQLDRLGAQMEALLNAGRAALRSEVVVASEDPQDAVDDGGGDWVEDELPAAGPSNLRRPRSGSLRRPRASSGTAIGGSLRRQHRPQELRPPPAYSTFNQNHSTPTLGGSVAGPSSSYGTPSPTSSPRSRTFAGSQPGSSVNEFSGLHAPFTTPPRRTAAAGRSNDAESWASPELRASMELARARYRR